MKLDIDLPPHRPIAPAAMTIDPSSTLPRQQRYRYFRPLLGGRRVLELFCGDGAGADFLAQSAEEVMGVDPSPAAFDHARESYRRSNLSFHLGEWIPSGSDGSFRAIVCFRPKADRKELDSLLASCRRALSPDGLLVLAIPNSDSLASAEARLAPHFPFLQFFRQAPAPPWDLSPGWGQPDPVVLAVCATTPIASRMERYLRPTAIVIPCHNNLRHSDLCLRSLAQFTREPIEVVIVDNGSTDRTPEWIAALRNAFDNIHVISNRENRGFAPAVNQGLAAFRDRNVVILNNDVVLTPGWLARMLMVLREEERCGMVGPVTNHAPYPQGVDGLGYGDDMGRMFQEAVRLSTASAGMGFEAARLSGFCLLLRRELIDAIGGLDERFRPGFFEDDDYGIRAGLAGFRLRVALDVFVHHFGGATFSRVVSDPRVLLQENWNRFKEKWGIPESVEIGPFAPGEKIAPTSFTRPRDFIPLPCSASA